jgi:hypothetical protein
VPAQDRAGGNESVDPQRSGQPLDQSGEDSPVRPVQAWSRVGAAEHGDLMPQHEQLDVLKRGRPAQQEDQSEHLLEDQIQQPQRHSGDHAEPFAATDRRWSGGCDRFWNPTGGDEPQSAQMRGQ